MIRKFTAFALVSSIACTGAAQNPNEAKATLEKAAAFFTGKISKNGGYVYYTAPDFSWRHGEGMATDSQVWVQPPGTPTVGMAFLKAYEATKEPQLLIAAVEAAKALIYGQLESGAWTNWIDFDPTSKTAGRYRKGGGSKNGKNFSTLDDGISQAAIQFMVLLDGALQQKNPVVHESATVALDAMLAAQFPNGAFPQGWDETLAVSNGDPKKRGNFPTHDWQTEGRIKEYWDMYTLNDDLAMTVSETLIVAHQTYGDDRYLKALKLFGDFLILSQMPEPQPGWAQQYNYEMQPIWARKFEPPAISGRESEGVVATLMRIAVYTKDKKYLEPIPAALAWLKRSLLPDGRLARYYELETNKPLYMERNGKVYSLTHDDSNLPSHYGWKNEAQIEALEAALKAIYAREPLPDPIFPPATPDPSIAEIISDLNADGAWISTYNGELLSGQPKFQPGQKYIHSGIFSRNMELLSAFLKSAE